MANSADIVIRPMQQADVPVMAHLHMRAVRQSFTGHYPDNVVKDWADSRLNLNYFKAVAWGETFLVAAIEDTPVGFISWHEGKLCGMYVDPDYHGQRIGSQLVAAADAQSNTAITFVNAAIPAQGFYEKMGFTSKEFTTDTVQGHTIACVHMRR